MLMKIGGNFLTRVTFDTWTCKNTVSPGDVRGLGVGDKQQTVKTTRITWEQAMTGPLPAIAVEDVSPDLWVLATNDPWKAAFNGRLSDRFADRLLDTLFGPTGTSHIRKALNAGQTSTSVQCPVRGKSATYNVTIEPVGTSVHGFPAYVLILDDVSEFAPGTVQAALGGPIEVSGIVDDNGIIVHVSGTHGIAPDVCVADGLVGVTLDHSLDYRDYTPGEPLRFDLEFGDGILYRLTVVVTEDHVGRMFHSRVDAIVPSRHEIVA